MVPLPNFTTRNPKTKEKTKKNSIEKLIRILCFLRKIFFPPYYQDLNDKEFSPFIQIKKNENEFFNIPSMEATINSRWRQTMRHWVGPLSLYIVFLIVYSTLSQIGLSDNPKDNINYYMICIFYYNGAYLLIIELMQMVKYKSKFFTIFNMLDLCSIILGIIVFTLILLVRLLDTVNGISNEAIISLTTVTTLILWIELVCLIIFIIFYSLIIFILIIYYLFFFKLLWFRLFSVIATNIFIFGNILKKIIPFFAFMFILIIGFGHSM
jgi:hypothetical protein